MSGQEFMEQSDPFSTLGCSEFYKFESPDYGFQGAVPVPTPSHGLLQPVGSQDTVMFVDGGPDYQPVTEEKQIPIQSGPHFLTAGDHVVDVQRFNSIMRMLRDEDGSPPGQPTSVWINEPDPSADCGQVNVSAPQLSRPVSAVQSDGRKLHIRFAPIQPSPNQRASTEARPIKKEVEFAQQDAPGASSRQGTVPMAVAARFVGTESMDSTPETYAPVVGLSEQALDLGLIRGPSLEVETGSALGMGISPPKSTLTPLVISPLHSSPGVGSDISSGQFEYGMLDSPGGPMKNRFGCGEERRTAHKLVEKRYRNSINEKIIELRGILAGPDSKLSKSSTLQKAIEFIRHAKEANRKLHQDNIELKRKLAEKGSFREVLEVGHVERVPEQSQPQAFQAPMANQHPPTQAAVQPANQQAPQVANQRPRFTVYALLMCFLVVNPMLLISHFWNGAADVYLTRGRPSRTLLGTNEDPRDLWESAGWRDRLLGLWIFDGLVLTCVLIRWYIYTSDHPPKAGSSKAKNWTRFWELKAESDNKADLGDYRSAAEHLASALAAIGRPLPVSGLSAIPFQLLTALRFFVRCLCQYSFRYRTKCHAAELKRELAMAYHKLNLWHNTGNLPQTSPLHRAYLAFKAAIYADVAAVVIPHATLAEVFLTSAYTLRQRFWLCAFFVKSLLTRVSRLTEQDEGVGKRYAWAVTPLGEDYLTTSAALVPDREPFVMFRVNYDGMLSIEDEFRVHLLDRLVSAALLPLPLPSNQDHIGPLLHGYPYTELQRSLELLENPRFWKRDDYQCRWWAHLLGANLLWLSKDLGGAQERYAGIRAIPQELLSNSLALASGHAFCARKVLVENANAQNAQAAVWNHCTKATEYIKDYWQFSDSGPLAQKIVILVHDWVLQSLCDLWQNRRSPFCRAALKCYRHNLHLLSDATVDLPQLRTKVMMYELTWRLMSSSNPLQTRSMGAYLAKSYEGSEDAMTLHEKHHFAQLQSRDCFQTCCY